MSYHENLIKQAFDDNFKDLPINLFIPNSSGIEITFTIPRSVEMDDDFFLEISTMLGAACRALSVAGMGKWEFYHPMICYKPERSGNGGAVSAKFFGSMKEKEVTKPSDTETDP